MMKECPYTASSRDVFSDTSLLSAVYGFNKMHYSLHCNATHNYNAMWSTAMLCKAMQPTPQQFTKMPKNVTHREWLNRLASSAIDGAMWGTAQSYVPLGADSVGNKQKGPHWMARYWPRHSFSFCAFFGYIIIFYITIIIIFNIIVNMIVLLRRYEPVALVLCRPRKKTVPGWCREEQALKMSSVISLQLGKSMA